MRYFAFAIFALLIAVTYSSGQPQQSGVAFWPQVPTDWDDEAVATLEVPLANPAYSPVHVSSRR